MSDEDASSASFSPLPRPVQKKVKFDLSAIDRLVHDHHTERLSPPEKKQYDHTHVVKRFTTDANTIDEALAAVAGDDDDNESDMEEGPCKPWTFDVERTVTVDDDADDDSSAILAINNNNNNNNNNHHGSTTGITSILSFATNTIQQNASAQSQREALLAKKIKLDCRLTAQKTLHELQMHHLQEITDLKFKLGLSQSKVVKLRAKNALLERQYDTNASMTTPSPSPSQTTKRHHRIHRNRRVSEAEDSDVIESNDAPSSSYVSSPPPTPQRHRKDAVTTTTTGSEGALVVTKKPSRKVMVPLVIRGIDDSDNNDIEDTTRTPATNSFTAGLAGHKAQRRAIEMQAREEAGDDDREDNDNDDEEEDLNALNDTNLTPLFASIHEKQPLPKIMAELVHFVNERDNVVQSMYYNLTRDDASHTSSSGTLPAFLVVPLTGFYKLVYLLPLLCGDMECIMNDVDRALLQVAVLLKSTCLCVTPINEQQMQQHLQQQPYNAGFVADMSKQAENTFNLRHLMQTVVTHCVLARAFESITDVEYDAAFQQSDVLNDITLNTPATHRMIYPPPQTTLVWGVSVKATPENHTQGKWKACRGCDGAYGNISKRSGGGGYRCAKHIPKKCLSCFLICVQHQAKRAGDIKFHTVFTTSAQDVETTIQSQIKTFDEIYIAVGLHDTIRRKFGRFLFNYGVPLPAHYSGLLIRSDGTSFGNTAQLKDVIAYIDRIGKSKSYRPMTKAQLGAVRTAHTKDRDAARQTMKPFLRMAGNGGGGGGGGKSQSRGTESRPSVSRQCLIGQVFQFTLEHALAEQNNGHLRVHRHALDDYLQNNRPVTPPPLAMPSVPNSTFDDASNSGNGGGSFLPLSAFSIPLMDASSFMTMMQNSGAAAATTTTTGLTFPSFNFTADSPFSFSIPPMPPLSSITNNNNNTMFNMYNQPIMGQLPVIPTTIVEMVEKEVNDTPVVPSTTIATCSNMSNNNNNNNTIFGDTPADSFGSTQRADTDDVNDNVLEESFEYEETNNEYLRLDVVRHRFFNQSYR